MVISLEPPEWGDRMVKKSYPKSTWATAVATLFANLIVSAIGAPLPGLGLLIP